MNATRWVLLAIVAAIGVGAVLLWQQSKPEPEAPAEEAAPAAAPESHYPLPKPQVETQVEPLPQLDGSDTAVRGALEQTFGKAPVESFLVPNEFVRHFVALVDSLDRQPVPVQFRPTKHVEGVPATQPEGELFILALDDSNRYAPWVNALDAIDSRKAVELYVRYYPLMQKAYEDLGYPKAYFNDRVVKILDHLLAAPEIDGRIELVRPKVLYLFADPALEQLSWGQKALIRMGRGNEAKVKAKLTGIRALVAANEEKTR